MRVPVYAKDLGGGMGETDIREYADGTVRIVVWLDERIGDARTLAHELVHVVQELAGADLDEGIAETWSDMLYGRYRDAFDARVEQLWETEETFLDVSYDLVHRYVEAWV